MVVFSIRAVSRAMSGFVSCIILVKRLFGSLLKVDMPMQRAYSKFISGAIPSRTHVR